MFENASKTALAQLSRNKVSLSKDDVLFMMMFPEEWTKKINSAESRIDDVSALLSDVGEQNYQ